MSVIAAIQDVISHRDAWISLLEKHIESLPPDYPEAAGLPGCFDKSYAEHELRAMRQSLDALATFQADTLGERQTLWCALRAAGGSIAIPHHVLADWRTDAIIERRQDLTGDFTHFRAVLPERTPGLFDRIEPARVVDMPLFEAQNMRADGIGAAFEEELRTILDPVKPWAVQFDMFEKVVKISAATEADEATRQAVSSKIAEWLTNYSIKWDR